jgi:DnaK suppressor protein
MKQRDLTVFKKLLNERRHELMSEAMGTMVGMGMADHENRESFPDPTDRASLEGNRNLTLRIRDRERKLITKIDEALGRIDDGTYGVCEECGGLIGVERLKARPVTTLCIQCKSEQEAEERRRKFA